MQSVFFIVHENVSFTNYAKDNNSADIDKAKDSLWIASKRSFFLMDL